MRIAYCIPELYNPGGMERVLTQKINYLVSVAKYDVSVITTEQQNKTIYFSLDKRVQIIDLPLNFNEHFDKGIFSKFILHHQKLRVYRKMLFDYLKSNEIDICVSLCGKEIEFLTKLKDGSVKVAEIHFAKNNRKQFLLARHSGKIWEWLGNIRTNQLVRSTQKLAKFVVLTKEDLKRWVDSNKNVIQIYNPCPIIDESIVADLSVRRFITVGKLDAQKGFDYLIPAWRLVADKYPDWRLDIYGQGEWHDMLAEMIKENRLEDIVSLKGVSNNIMKEYVTSSGYVMSSRYEGFPMVLLEAMACGLPVVSFDCESGPNEVIRNGENGFLVPFGNIELLSDKICKIIENNKLRFKMGACSKEMSKSYQYEKIMRQWVNLFESLIKK